MGGHLNRPLTICGLLTMTRTVKRSKAISDKSLIPTTKVTFCYPSRDEFYANNQ